MAVRREQRQMAQAFHAVRTGHHRQAPSPPGSEAPRAARYEPMVLVSYILEKHVSFLQTKFSNREGHEARRVRLETMPLDQHIEERHREREPCLKIRPRAVHDFLDSIGFFIF